jgi:hypothetical protein
MASRGKITAIIAAAALPLATGCGGSPAPTQGRSAKTPAEQAFAYARCIRAHGVPAFPDPQVSTTPGSVGIRQAVPAAAGLSHAFPAAQKACRGIMPSPQNGSSNDDRAHKQALLAFAHCLRTHGVTAFPDPTANGDLSPQMISAAGVDIHAHSFFNAAKACVGVTHGMITIAQVEAAISGRH